MSDYFDTLARLLRDRGVPDHRITATVDDLTAYAQESGADPEEEFGPVAEFAAQLGPEPEPETGGPAEGTWVWTADIFADEQRLNEFGDQGWEVEKVDRLGRFVSHRDPERAQRWEYRREVVLARGRSLTERLAPDGWEPCGTWFHYEYFKRPRAASVGPAAAIDSPPPAAGRQLFFSRRFYLLAVLLLVACVLAVVGAARTSGSEATGFTVGAVVGATAVIVALWLLSRRRDH
ncbi:hypothetical protein Misp01_62220 [Microtetraspora sp. NBRC 13810]|uniref:hypothetical protein n=1 Tax=Microtetraspora sp. NBRC 13810 TaxID=3030990 RepID=UPI0024A3F4BD|nr:hypothetical protein [Microtetraspora sp. NBRC 13810]GLW11094.1 hypothetical protein Misp01_62220 [Microtetraspora sp. NBRC 13810]